MKTLIDKKDLDLLELKPIEYGDILSDKALELLEYLQTHHYGRENSISAMRLSVILELSIYGGFRELRHYIQELREVIPGMIQSNSSDGYWYWNGEESDRDKMLFNRFIKSAQRAITTIDELKIAYKELNEISKRLNL